MTGYNVVSDALNLLGYEQTDEKLLSKALTAVKMVYNDMKRMQAIADNKEICSLNDKIEIPDKTYNVFIAGVAAYIAECEGDDNKQAYWMKEYQQRKTSLSQIGEIKDVIPIPEY